MARRSRHSTLTVLASVLALAGVVWSSRDGGLHPPPAPAVKAANVPILPFTNDDVGDSENVSQAAVGPEPSLYDVNARLSWLSSLIPGTLSDDSLRLFAARQFLSYSSNTIRVEPLPETAEPQPTTNIYLTSGTASSNPDEYLSRVSPLRAELR